MHTMILLNSEAGTGVIQKKMQHVLASIQKPNSYEMVEFGDPGELETQLLKIQTGRVFIVGGDGSVNSVIQVILKHGLDIQLGIIPAGTVNDFAAYLGIGLGEKALKAYLKSNRMILCDAGKINDRFFINVAAVGYVADIGFAVSRQHKKIFGRLAYYFKGVKDAFTKLNELRTYTLTIDNVERRIEALMLIVINSGSLGGMQNFNPYASLTDGLLELYIFKKISPARGLLVFLDVLMGKHKKNPEIEKIHFRELKIESSQALSMDIDGEKGNRLPVTITVIPGRLQLLLPERRAKGRH